MAMSEDELRDLEEYFYLFDKDQDAKLNVEEAGKLWRSIGANPTEAEVQAMFKHIDVDGSSFVDWNEFKSWMSLHGKEIMSTNLEEDMREAFRVFDRDGNGFISRVEFKRIMKDLGDEPLSDEDLDNLMRGFDEVDADGDHNINYEEFIPIFVSMSKRCGMDDIHEYDQQSEHRHDEEEY